MRPIPGYEGYYAIDEGGKVTSIARAVSYKGKKSGTRFTTSKFITPYPCNTNGNMKIQLYKDGKKRTFYVHKLVEQVYGK